LRRNISLPASVSKYKPSKKLKEAGGKLKMRPICFPIRQALSELHGVATQKTVNAVRASKSKSTLISSYIVRNYL
jgi:hypothetical protein